MIRKTLMHYLPVCLFLVTVTACSRENTEPLVDSDALDLQQNVKPPPVEGIGVHAVMPVVAVRGETVYLVGTGFSTDTKVSINGINCPVVSSNYKQLTFTIPQNSAIVGGTITFQKGSGVYLTIQPAFQLITRDTLFQTDLLTAIFLT